MLNVAQELASTVEMLQGLVYADDRGRKTLSADLMKTFNIASGFQPYDLSPVAYILTPTFSPFRNRTPRLQRQGKNYEFKAVTNVNSGNTKAIATEGTLAPAISTQFADVTVTFEPYGLSSDPVTLEQQFAGIGHDPGSFDVDSRALAVANLLKAVMQQEEILMWGGVASSSTQIVGTGGDDWTFGGGIGTAATPAVTAANTGGALTGTVYVKVTQLTMMGESEASNAASNAFGTAVTTGTLTVTPAPVANTVFTRYNVYASTNGTNYYLQGSTNGANFTIKSVSTGGVAPPTVDTTAAATFNGVLAHIFAGGTNATQYAVNGVMSSMSPINTMLENMWTNAYADPDDLWCHANEVNTISTNLIGSGQPYYFMTEQGQQPDLIANQRASRVLNQTTQKIMPLNVHALLTQGQIIATSSQVPAWYVGANIPGVWGQQLTMDYTEIDYQPVSTQPTWLSEIRCYGALSCYVPQVNGIVTGIESASGVNP